MLKTLFSRAPFAPFFVLVLVMIMGALLRFGGLNWDENNHLHPDERFVTMVANALSLPDSPRQYLSIDTSPLSPYNTTDFKGYLYGQFPLSLAKLVAWKTNRDNYNEFTLVARALSALADTLSIGLVFLLARRLMNGSIGESDTPKLDTGESGALVAAALYALCPFAIQNAHFGTMESWLTFWTLVTILGAASVVQSRTRGATVWALALCVIGLSFAASCKISGLLVLAPVFLVLGARWKPWQSARFPHFLLAFLTVCLGSAFVFRLVSPYHFASSTWLDWRPNNFLSGAWQQQAAYMNGEAMAPPQYQWMLSKPWTGPAWNFGFWALGPCLGLAAVVGTAQLALSGWKNRRDLERGAPRFFLVVFMALSFAFIGSRFVHTVRYLMPIVPLCCLAAAFALCRNPFSRRFRIGVALCVLVPTALSALAFTSIYRRPSTRVAASRFLLDAAPRGAKVAIEHWDDPLPLQLDPRAQGFKGQMMPVFDPDSLQKIDRFYESLSQSEFLILSSPRAWKTVGRLPAKFPLMARYYELLFAGKLRFQPVATFESHPRFAGLSWSDVEAEEVVWVYDHPPVSIFRRPAFPSSFLSQAQFRALFADLNLPATG